MRNYLLQNFLTYVSAQTSSFSYKQFFPYVFRVLFFVLNIAIAFLYHFSKNVINSTIATLYYVDIRSTHLFYFLTTTDANNY